MPGVGAGWLARLERRIAAEEYEVTWQTRTVLGDVREAWQAPNRAQGLRSYFLPAGIRVVPRREKVPSWEWGLELVGYGRGARRCAVDAARPTASGARVEYARGNVTEWYENSPAGIEQGFVLWVPPERFCEDGRPSAVDRGVVRPGALAASLSGPPREPSRVVHVDLRLAGTLSPAFASDGQAIDFRAPSGANVLHYAALAVTDAGGRRLPAWFEGYAGPDGGGIRIAFDDADAAYPVRIDPLATSPSWTGESDQTGARFGYSVATAGDVDADGYSDVVVGAYTYDTGQTDAGRVYLYRGSASGLSATPSWTADGDQGWAYLGCSVATAGDVNGDGFSDIIVGARAYDNGETDEGRAYIYFGSAAGPGAAPDWTVEGDQAGASLGFSVATAGDVNGDGYSDVIVGARQYDGGQTDEGRALVYHGSAAGPSTTADWTAEGNQAGAYFGGSVATAGDVNGDGFADVIIGALLYDGGETNEGRAYVFFGSPSGLSTTADWTAEGNQAGAYFGGSVATAGDVNGDGYADIIVGARLYDGTQTDAGKVFVYYGSADGPDTDFPWTAEGDQASARFGVAVGTAGDIDGDGYADIIIGADGYDNGETDEGRAYVYFGSSLGLSSGGADWTAESDQPSASFGVSVATAGDVNGDGYSDVIVGAHLYDNGETNEGRAFVYHGSPSGLTYWDWYKSPDQAFASFGVSVATAGDVNGDGYSDVIVGASRYDNGENDEGRAYVFLGSRVGLESDPIWTAESNQPGAMLGISVATAGDVNGDGYSDVIVGASEFDTAHHVGAGRAFVFHGSASGPSPDPDWTYDGDQDFAYLGNAVATAGDVNGDGYADVIVGAYGYDNGETDEGRAFVFHGSAAGLALDPAWTAEGNQAGAEFGWAVGTAGDVNGDGYADVIIGADGFDTAAVDAGRAYLYLGSASGLASVPAWTADGPNDSDFYGFAVGTAGDVNGDGYADVIVGAKDYGTDERGLAEVYLGSGTGLSASADWHVEGTQAYGHFGAAAAMAGDVNGDGYADVIVSAPDFDTDGTDGGRVYLYRGSASGLGTSPSWITESDYSFAEFGYAAGTAGDVNGDGYADVIVGAPYRPWWYDSEGVAFVYHGGGGDEGIALRPQQRRLDIDAPIAREGASRTAGGFRLAALGRGPFGRTRLAVEAEAKAGQQPFDGSASGRSAGWTDSGTGGATLSLNVTGLDPGDYHWRLRLLYDPAASPFQPASRWFTVPWGGWHETDLRHSVFLGGVVWEDADGDGIRETTEARLGNIRVELLDDAQVVRRVAYTDASGTYRFEVDHSSVYFIRFVAPDGYVFTTPDQGPDDLIDSDAHQPSGETDSIGPPYTADDADRWGAGLRQDAPCHPPVQAVEIPSVRRDANGNVVLDIHDPNAANSVTGYDIYRASDASLDPAQWPLVASDVVDEDASRPDVQWTDTAGDVSPSRVWFYDVAAYNHTCGAEGPR
ncbi:MAG: hypothetical protein Kow0062_19400 [Acidobacteriota bacterium]